MLRYPILSPRSKEFLYRPFIQEQIKIAWMLLEADPAYATPNLSNWFRKNRSLGSRDRKIVSEILFILIRFQNYFEKLGLQNIEQRLKQLEQDSWARNDEPSLDDIACFLSIAPWIVAQWSEELSREELISLANQLQSRAPIDIRVNPLKTTRKKLIDLLRNEQIEAQEIEHSTLGIRIESRANIQGHKLYQNGFFELQDAASQIFCEAIPVSQQAVIFDMCAGSGGKSLTLKALHPKAKIFAQEPRSNAQEEHQKRASRAAVKILFTKPKQPVDIVIVDVPCSGLGRLRREPTLRFRWKEQHILQFVEVQQQILEEAKSYVKESGSIIYATCSLLKAENQHNLEGWNRKTTMIWPHRYDCDGFSYSIYQKE